MRVALSGSNGVLHCKHIFFLLNPLFFPSEFIPDGQVGCQRVTMEKKLNL